MPRQAGIDVPGALHHIITKGVGRKKIFNVMVTYFKTDINLFGKQLSIARRRYWAFVQKASHRENAMIS
jgi:hypothetical protein